ncbi:MAG: hypothetical protein BWY86_01473 [Candidatus Aminicenantes bacterium ADurb.Bin508]|nr:MAG: hypothetical protein BWY86_01473 [Candidatus Aminicenantes bacterium ADurb.Bin508]
MEREGPSRGNPSRGDDELEGRNSSPSRPERALASAHPASGRSDLLPFLLPLFQLSLQKPSRPGFPQVFPPGAEEGRGQTVVDPSRPFPGELPPLRPEDRHSRGERRGRCGADRRDKEGSLRGALLPVEGVGDLPPLGPLGGPRRPSLPASGTFPGSLRTSSQEEGPPSDSLGPSLPPLRWLRSPDSQGRGDADPLLRRSASLEGRGCSLSPRALGGPPSLVRSPCPPGCILPPYLHDDLPPDRGLSRLPPPLEPLWES